MNHCTIEDIANYGNLLIAHTNAKKDKTKYSAVKRFEANRDELLHRLEETILSGNYRTSKYREKVIIDSGKERLIAKLPYYPDRIVHWAIMLQLEAEFIRQFSSRTHAAIPDRGTLSALYQIRGYLLQNPNIKYCLKIDVKKYFPHIDHEVLKQFMRRIADDPKVLELIDEIIDSYPTGIPIGNYTSQYFANIYLTPLDRQLESEEEEHTRYMDDIPILGESKEELREILENIREYLREELHVEVKENWQIFPIESRGIDFVGYRIWRNRVILRKSIYLRLRRKTEKCRKHAAAGTFSEHDRCVLSSEFGLISHCTPKVRRELFKRHILPTLELLPDGEKFKQTLLKRFKKW